MSKFKRNRKTLKYIADYFPLAVNSYIKNDLATDVLSGDIAQGDRAIYQGVRNIIANACPDNSVVRYFTGIEDASIGGGADRSCVNLAVGKLDKSYRIGDDDDDIETEAATMEPAPFALSFYLLRKLFKKPKKKKKK